MKTLKFFIFQIVTLGIILSSCKNDSEVIPENNSANVMHERTLTIQDADRKESVALRFRSSSKELLDDMPIESFDFTLVKVSSPAANNSVGQVSSSGSHEENYSLGSAHQKRDGDVGIQRPTKLSDSEPVKRPQNIVWVDLVSNKKNQSFSVEVKNKTSNNGRITSLLPVGTEVFFHGSGSWHRIHIDNLSSYPLHVGFYYNSCVGNICETSGGVNGVFTKYSGYSYTLYQNGWAWYSNCNKGVGAMITIAPNNSWHYRWTWWTNC
jgi:hypothetical protein